MTFGQFIDAGLWVTPAIISFASTGFGWVMGFRAGRK